MPYRPALYYLAAVTLTWTLILILIGGNVTSKGVGMAVPDWPTTFQQYNPPGWTQMPGVRDEHGHRLIGALVGLFTTVLCGWVAWVDPRRWMKILAGVAWISVVVQGLMGGFRVTEDSLTLAVIHGIFAHLFLCMVLAMMLAVSRRWLTRDAAVPVVDPALRWLAPGLIASILMQLVLGAIYRHHAIGILWHVAGALVVGIFALLACMFATSVEGHDRRVTRLAVGCGVVYLAQLAAGLSALLVVDPQATYDQMSMAEMVLPTVHQTIGALILAIAFAMSMWVYRHRGPRESGEFAT